MASVYLETSALLCILFKEAKENEIVKRLHEADHIFSSRLTKVEVERALHRIGIILPKQQKYLPHLIYELRNFWPKIDFLEMTKDICDLAGRIAPQFSLRSLDALHLASFYRLREIDPSIEMLSLDERIKTIIE